jgi:hypothetical protein
MARTSSAVSAVFQDCLTIDLLQCRARLWLAIACMKIELENGTSNTQVVNLDVELAGLSSIGAQNNGKILRVLCLQFLYSCQISVTVDS